MRILCFKLKAKTEFSTQIKGDTLFGFLCCYIAERYGEERLNSLLADYTKDNPFMIVSDFFPYGFLPRPTVPTRMLGENVKAEERKLFKQKKWIAVDNVSKPLNEWSLHLQKISYQTQVGRTHNSINPKMGIVGGDDAYAPYTLKNTFYQSMLSVYIMFDDKRISADEIKEIMTDTGLFGIGKGASRGTGKFEVISSEEVKFSSVESNSYMTLSPCIPQRDDVDAEKSYYKPFTRFGKQYMFPSSNTLPHKNPVLMADTGAVFCFKTTPVKPYIGCGVNDVSKDRNIVCQGYAPIVPLMIGE